MKTYWEDMMEKLAGSPGMYSDGSGTTQINRFKGVFFWWRKRGKRERGDETLVVWASGEEYEMLAT